MFRAGIGTDVSSIWAISIDRYPSPPLHRQVCSLWALPYPWWQAQSQPVWDRAHGIVILIFLICALSLCILSLRHGAL